MAGLNFRLKIFQYLTAFFVILIITLINLTILSVAGYWTIAIIFLFTVSILSFFLSTGPSLFSASLSAILWNFVFIPPRWTFFIHRLEDLLMFVMYFIVAIITSNLTSRLHSKEAVLRKRENFISGLYEISKNLSNASSIPGIVDSVVKLTDDFFSLESTVFLTDESGSLKKSAENNSPFKLNKKGHEALLLSFNNRSVSGKFTGLMDDVSFYFSPLLSQNNVLGVFAIKLNDKTILTLEQRDFIENFSQQAANALEKALLTEAKQKALMADESEKLYKIILNSITHELRTPLTSLTVAVSGLLDENMFSNFEIKNILLTDIREAAERMNRIIGNLLDMIRLESGRLKLNLHWCDVNEVIGFVLNRLRDKLKNYLFTKEINDENIFIYADFSLIEQVVYNLVLNSMEHNRDNTEIGLKVYKELDNVIISVKDNGTGIPAENIKRIFDKFYRGKKTNTGGLGLGLSICKTIIELHKGHIYAVNNENSGVTFNVLIPVKSG